MDKSSETIYAISEQQESSIGNIRQSILAANVGNGCDSTFCFLKDKVGDLKILSSIRCSRKLDKLFAILILFHREKFSVKV